MLFIVFSKTLEARGFARRLNTEEFYLELALLVARQV